MSRKVLGSAVHLRRLAEAQLRKGLSAESHGLLDAVAAREEIELPPILTWRRLGDYLEMPEALSPALYVTTPGTDGDPVKVDRETDRADWLVRCFVVVIGTDYEQTSDRRDAYLAAARLALRADPTLGGYAEGVEWVGDTDNEADVGDEDARWLGVGSVTLRYLRVLTASRIEALRPENDPTAPTADRQEVRLLGFPAPADPVFPAEEES